MQWGIYTAIKRMKYRVMLDRQMNLENTPDERNQLPEATS